MEPPKWKRFEELVASIQKELSGNAMVTLDDKIVGKRTGVPRQIDVSVRQQVGQFEVLIVIDCKDYARPLDVKGVEEFMGLAQDVGAHRAAMVAAQGYTEAAKKRAQDAGIELYRVIDTGDHPWKTTSFLPAACIFTGIEAFSLRFSATGFFRMGTNNMGQLVLFDREENRLGEIRELLWQKWNERQLPETPGRYEKVELAPNPVKIETDGEFYEINVSVSLIIETDIYAGEIGIAEISGFRDELRGETITRSITTESMEWADIVRSWQRISSLDQLAVKPAMVLRAFRVYGEE